MQGPKKRVLILDAETRSALAVIRSLGASQYPCISASHETSAIGSKSKYSSKALRSPNSILEPEKYFFWLKETIHNEKIKIVLPTTDATIEALAPFSKELQNVVHYPIIPSDTLHAVQDKSSLLKRAENHSIRTPQTVSCTFSRSSIKESLISIEKIISYPFILKPSKSVQEKADGTCFSPPRKIIHSLKEGIQFFSFLKDDTLSYLAQEIIEGSGIGIFCLYHQGKSILNFSHKRILEKPPEGGVSVLSESIPLDPKLLEKVHHLLHDLSWSGVAMVEFKLNREGIPVLMEINPRFWGSLQLAIDSGCNFPLTLLEPAGTPQHTYTLHKRLRWELGTLDHILIKMKQQGFLKTAGAFLKNQYYFFNRNTHSEVCRLNDPVPFIYELKKYFSRPL
jgi:predicted ATP-grasp superfamily ATP-dependent carboligase